MTLGENKYIFCNQFFWSNVILYLFSVGCHWGRAQQRNQLCDVQWWCGVLQSLECALKSALRSDLEDVCLALLKTPAQFDAYLFRKATKVLSQPHTLPRPQTMFCSFRKLSSVFHFPLWWQRLGTDEDALVEILATRTNQEIREVERVFKEGFKTHSVICLCRRFICVFICL